MKIIVLRGVIVNSDAIAFIAALAIGLIAGLTTYIVLKIGEKSRAKAKATIEKETDQNKLAEITKNAKKHILRMEAVKKINDQYLLADIAKNNSDAEVCEMAVWRLNDQSFLREIEDSHPNENVRGAARVKLQDMNTIKKGDTRYCPNSRYGHGWEKTGTRGSHDPVGYGEKKYEIEK